MSRHAERKSRGTWRRRVLFWLTTLLAAFLIMVGGLALIYVTHPPKPADADRSPLQQIADDIRSFVDPELVFPKTSFTVLVLGLDENYTEKDILYTKNTRSDTILVASLALKEKTVRVLSIPRDSYVSIPGHGHEKINAAYAIGDLPLAKKTVEEFLGVPLDYTVVLKVRATQHVVDALRGVEVVVDKAMDYDDNWGHLHIHLKPGSQVLNGEQALGFSRFRNDERGDFARMERQQQLLRAVIRKFKDPAMWSRLGEIVKIFKQNVDTTLTFPQLVALANLYRDLEPTDLKAATLQGEATFVGGMSVVVHDEAAKEKVVDELLRFPAPEKGTGVMEGPGDRPGVKVEVLNGTGAPLAATRAAEQLRGRGYSVARVADADRFDYRETVVIDRRGEPALSRDILEILGRGTVKVERKLEGHGGEADLTVILGKDYADLHG